MNYTQLLKHTSAQINEVMPWELADYLANRPDATIIDVRETHEYELLRINNSITVPRGILESACSWGFSETVPELARSRQKPVLLLCRSGHRSAFAALRLQMLGFEDVASLKLGLKGLNDENYPIFDLDGNKVDADLAEERLNPPVRNEQMSKH